MLRWLLEHLAPGVHVTCNGSTSIKLSVGGLITGLGNLAAVVLIAWVYVQFLTTLVRFEYFGPLTNVEETAYSWNIGRNFAQYGFLQTLFLQDVGHSPYAADHPYTYNHQPPGLDIITGVILSAFPESFRLARFLFSLVFITGLFAYFSFANVILRAYGLPLAGFTVLFINVGIVLLSVDKQTAYIQPLMLFGPWWLYTKSLRGSRSSYFAALLLTLIASLTLDYVVLAAVLWGWVFLYLTQVIPVTFRWMLLFCSVIVLGIVLHLIQNLLFLGWDIFVQEFLITIGNRTIGYPSTEQVHDFYKQISVVHHGSHPPDAGVLIRQLIRQFDFSLSLPAHVAWLLLALGSLTLAALIIPQMRWIDHTRSILIQRNRWLDRAGQLIRLWVWIVGTIALPNIMFPAYNQEVTLIGSGVPLYFLALGALALIMTACRCALPAKPANRTQLLKAWAWWKSWYTARDRRVWMAWFSLALLLPLVAIPMLPVLAVLSVRTSAVPREARLVVYALSFALFVLLILQLGSRLTKARNILGELRPTTVYPDSDQTTAALEPAAPRNELLRGAWRMVWLTGGIVVRVLLCGLVVMVLLQTATLRLNEMGSLVQTISTSKYAQLADLRAFSGSLFMTNINSPLVGFFTRAPGFGVCELDALSADADVDSQSCLIDFQRRHTYWASQAPRYFFFFRTPGLFPGFGTCLPNQTLQGVTRGGDHCIAQAYSRLSDRAEKIFANELFEVFDLYRSPSDAKVRTMRLASPQVTVAAAYSNAIMLSWGRVDDATSYAVEAKEAPESEFHLVGTVNGDDRGLLVSGLGVAHRNFFRVAACTPTACSPYTYIEGRTSPR